MATIQDVRNAGVDPQRAYEWEIEVFGNAVTGSLPLLTARAENVNLPEKSVEQLIINYKSRKAHWPGRDASPGTFTVQFWDDERQEVYTFFNDWMENGISNSVTGGGLAKDLVAIDMVAKLLAHDENTVTGRHNFANVWPSSIGDVTLDYSDSSQIIFTVTFTYDIHTQSPGA